MDRWWDSGWHMEATGGAPQVPIEQVEKPPLGTQRLDNHNDRRSSSWHGPIPRFHKRRICQGDGMLHAKAQSHALTAMPGGMMRVWGRGYGPLEKQWCVSVLIQETNCLRNNHTADAQTCQTYKPTVITGTDPSVKIVTVQTAGSHKTQTQVYMKTCRHPLIVHNTTIFISPCGH